MAKPAPRGRRERRVDLERTRESSLKRQCPNNGLNFFGVWERGAGRAEVVALCRLLRIESSSKISVKAHTYLFPRSRRGKVSDKVLVSSSGPESRGGPGRSSAEQIRGPPRQRRTRHPSRPLGGRQTPAPSGCRAPLDPLVPLPRTPRLSSTPRAPFARLPDPSPSLSSCPTLVPLPSPVSLSHVPPLSPSRVPPPTDPAWVSISRLTGPVRPKWRSRPPSRTHLCPPCVSQKEEPVEGVGLCVCPSATKGGIPQPKVHVRYSI